MQVYKTDFIYETEFLKNHLFHYCRFSNLAAHAAFLADDLETAVIDYDLNVYTGRRYDNISKANKQMEETLNALNDVKADLLNALFTFLTITPPEFQKSLYGGKIPFTDEFLRVVNEYFEDVACSNNEIDLIEEFKKALLKAKEQTA